MDKKTFIDKIKTLFSEIENSVESKLIDVKTIDGVTLRIKEEIKEGVVVYVVNTEDDSETIAPEGEHNIGDKTISTNVDGVITEIKENEEEVEEEVEEVEDKKLESDVLEQEMSEEVEEEEVEDKVLENPLEDRIKSLETAIGNLSESLSAIEILSEKVEKMSALPSDKEIKLSKSEGLKKEKMNSREEKLKFLSNRK